MTTREPPCKIQRGPRQEQDNRTGQETGQNREQEHGHSAGMGRQEHGHSAGTGRQEHGHLAETENRDRIDHLVRQVLEQGHSARQDRKRRMG